MAVLLFQHLTEELPRGSRQSPVGRVCVRHFRRRAISPDGRQIGQLVTSFKGQKRERCTSLRVEELARLGDDQSQSCVVQADVAPSCRDLADIETLVEGQDDVQVGKALEKGRNQKRWREELDREDVGLALLGDVLRRPCRRGCTRTRFQLTDDARRTGNAPVRAPANSGAA